MAGAGESLSEEGGAPHSASQIEDIEQDLDTVDEALAALDSGDLEAAEALAAELDEPGAGPSGGDEQSGDEQSPETGAASQ